MADQTLVKTFTDIADAIREKDGSTGTMTPAEMPGKIAAIGTLPNAGTLLQEDTWYKGTTAKNILTKISIVDKYIPTGSETESWDASVAQDESIKCYIAGTNLIIAGNGAGRIKANANSNKLFSNTEDVNGLVGTAYVNVKTIDGLDLLDTSSVTKANYMFGGLASVKHLNLSKLDTSKITTMGGMFTGCKSLIGLDLSNFNTSNVYEEYYAMESMFAYCHSLTNLDLSSFDTSRVLRMYGMFEQCKSLVGLDLSSFNTKKVKNMAFMFANCDRLRIIYASSLWSTASCTNSDSMFYMDYYLSGGISYDGNHTDKTYATTSGGYLTYRDAPTA